MLVSTELNKAASAFWSSFKRGSPTAPRRLRKAILGNSTISGFPIVTRRDNAAPNRCFNHFIEADSRVTRRDMRPPFANTIKSFPGFVVEQLSSAFAVLHLLHRHLEKPLARRTPARLDLSLPDSARRTCLELVPSIARGHIQAAFRLLGCQFDFRSYDSRSPRVGSRVLMMRTVSPSSVCDTNNNLPC